MTDSVGKNYLAYSYIANVVSMGQLHYYFNFGGYSVDASGYQARFVEKAACMGDK